MSCPDFYSDIEDFTQILCRYLPKKLAVGTSEMESRLVSPERQAQNDTGNVSRSRMQMNFCPEIFNAKERGVLERSERLDPNNFTDSLRKRRLADLSDPDLQIIASRQRNMSGDFQVKSLQILIRLLNLRVTDWF